jgi:hypothetical protein
VSEVSVAHYVLCRVEDDESLTVVSEHDDLVLGVAAGKHTVEVEDHDYAYFLHNADGMRVATFADGRICYREWARRSGYVHSLDDQYDHDIDELMGV